MNGTLTCKNGPNVAFSGVYNDQLEAYMQLLLRLFILLLITVPIGACELAGDIFQGGLILGIIIAVIVIALVMKLFGGRKG